MTDDIDKALRPPTFKDFVGQDQVKKNLSIYVQASNKRRERKESSWALDHVLFSGLAGLGKTTLANIIAYEVGSTLKTTSGPILEKAGDLAGILTKLEPGDVLFIDEVHRLKIEVEEFLYSAMEDYKIDIVLGSGATSSKTVTLALKPFTLIGATTREDLLTKPFRDRFGIHETLNLYSLEESIQIANRSAGILGVEIDGAGSSLIAKASRGVPRNINKFVRRLRDVAEIEGEGIITESIARLGLKMQGIDDNGLGENERKILNALVNYPKGVGLKTLARTLNLGDKTIEEVYEPFLLAQGLIKITSKGRALTEKGAKTIACDRQQSIKFE